MSAESWSDVAPEGDPEQLPDAADVRAMDALGTQRRRIMTVLLAEIPHEIQLGELATYVAAVELDKEPRAISSDERKPRYIGLYQNDNEKMVAAGLIIYDERGKVIGSTDLLDAVAETMIAVMEIEESSLLDRCQAVLVAAGYNQPNREVPMRPWLYRIPTGSELRAMREAAGIKQTDLAERAGVQPSSISTYENQNSGLGVDRLRTVLGALREVWSE